MGCRSACYLAEENQTLQALRDALNLRDIVFKSFPEVNNAELRMFRASVDHLSELVMTGSVNRTNEACSRVGSVAMRAMLCGFRFTMAEGVLESIDRVPVVVPEVLSSVGANRGDPPLLCRRIAQYQCFYF